MFQEGQYSKALRKYKLITKWLDDDLDFSEEQLKTRQTLRLTGYNNCAMCYIKEENWIKVKEMCNEALQLDDQNVKSLFRRGQVILTAVPTCYITKHILTSLVYFVGLYALLHAILLLIN